MIVIFSSSFAEEDPQVGFLVEVLKGRAEEFLVINPHHLNLLNPLLWQKGDKVHLSVGGSEVVPQVFYLSRMWRSDCVIVSTPQDGVYPAVFRSRVNQFMQDIRFGFEDRVQWFPGKLESVERGESKPRVLSMANSMGIDTPLYTKNCFSQHFSYTDGDLYRKSLGPPFVISLNTNKGEEVAVTTLNELVDCSCLEDDHNLWQWQEPVLASAQLRCFVVDEHVWAVRWSRANNHATVDFRFLNEVEQVEVDWVPYSLPSELVRNLVKLVSSLGLKVAAPEFLIRQDGGEHVLIDLNPCGDWYGFFDDDTHLEIGHALADLLVKARHDNTR